MIIRQFDVINPQGLHMRPAVLFAKAMAIFPCDVSIYKDGHNANGKNAMSIMAACIKCGSRIEVVCDGECEQDAIEEAARMLETGFGELV